MLNSGLFKIEALIAFLVSMANCVKETSAVFDPLPLVEDLYKIGLGYILNSIGKESRVCMP